MLEIKMTDGEKLRMNASYYKVDTEDHILLVKTRDETGATYFDTFNLKNVVYIGEVTRLHPEEGNSVDDFAGRT